MRAWLFLFLIVLSQQVKSAVFLVTNNADAGVGSLREAIQMANANGTADRDFIHFNIVTSNAAGVTILLNTELPILNSNVVLDATTQPTAFLGNPNIRILLTKINTNYFSGIRLDNASDIEIYGIEFSNFQSLPTGPLEDKKGGVYLRNSHRIIIGSSAKPNCFNGSYAGVLSPYIIPRIDVSNITISGNIFGLSASGQTSSPNESGIDLSFLKNSLIGGNSSQDGNILANHTRIGIALGGADQDIKIANNIIGANQTMSTVYRVASTTGIFINGNLSKPLILNNYILGQAKGVNLDYVNGGFVLEGNKIGIDNSNTTSWGNEVGIHIRFCNAGMIGGATSAAGNVIAYNITPVIVELAYPISILRNSFYCNTKPIEFVNLPTGRFVTNSMISNISATQVSGAYLPNSKIELFYTDACVDCQGKEWIATILTGASGNWSYNGAIDLSRSITSLGTNQDGATATFSKPLMNENSSVVTDVICNQPTGSIRGIITYDASVFEWRNANGDIVGTNRDLENVPPGTYRLTARQNNVCSVLSRLYTISSSASGISEVNKQVSPAYCGQENGSIRGITTTGNSPRVWYNANGLEVSRDNDLIGVAAGTYFFTTQLGSCNVTSPIYTVNNIEFNYVVAREEIADATCSSNNGSIKVLNYQSDRPDNVKWFNSDGQELGNTENLIGLSPGRYKLVGYSNFGCSYPIKEFVINEILPPTIDESGLKEYISCDGKSVTTSGILVNGQTSPYSYSWVDQNQNVVATTLNLKKAPLGKYTLKVTDRFGCVISGNLIDFTILEKTVLKIPNAFTPNGDAVNDFWEIKGVENYPDAEFRVFNRSGGLVFSSRGYEKPFDGNFKGKNLPVGVYYYKINLNEECGIQSGSLTIIR